MYRNKYEVASIRFFINNKKTEKILMILMGVLSVHLSKHGIERIKERHEYPVKILEQPKCIEAS